MKVKKNLKPENEIVGSRPHKWLCTCYKGVEACQEECLLKLSQWCFWVHIWNKHHPYKIQLEGLSPDFVYMEFARCYSWDDQIAYAKACLVNHYEKPRLKEEVMTHRCQMCTT